MDLMSNEFTDMISKLKLAGLDFRPFIERLEHAEELRKGILSRSVAKLEDRVELIKTPDINEKDSWGWMGAKHFLKAGAKGFVKELSFWDGKIRYGIIFDLDSYIFDGKLNPVERKGIYMFPESYIKKIQGDDE